MHKQTIPIKIPIKTSLSRGGKQTKLHRLYVKAFTVGILKSSHFTTFLTTTLGDVPGCGHREYFLSLVNAITLF